MPHDFALPLKITRDGLRRRVSDEALTDWETHLDPITNILAQFQANAAALEQSRDYTEAGRSKKLAELAAAAHATILARVSPKLEKYEAARASIERRLDKSAETAVSSETEQLLDYLRGRELRGLFVDPTDQLKNEIVYRDAVAQGNVAHFGRAARLA